MTNSIFDGEDTLAGIVWILTSVAALNWGTVEFFDINLVGELAALAGGSSGTVELIVYGIIAFAGVVTLLDHLGLYDVTTVIDELKGAGS